MAKKKVEQNTAPIKPMAEMSDSEFITYADYLSSPYYRQYMSAKGEVVAEDKVKEEVSSVKGKKNKTKAKKVKAEKLYVKKRALPLVLIAVLTLVIIAVAVIGFIGIDGVSPYISIYNIPESEDVSTPLYLHDPIIGFVKNFVDLDMESVYYTNVLEGNVEGADFLSLVTLYAVPVACALALIFAVIGFIKAIVALCSGKKNGYYKKFKFGFLSVAILLCGLIGLVGGLYVSGTSITEILTFLDGTAANMTIGIGLYVLIGAPIITLIMSCMSYKKLK